MDTLIISLVVGLVVFIWFVFFAKHLMNWMFSIKKRTELMQEQNNILREIRDQLKNQLKV